MHTPSLCPAAAQAIKKRVTFGEVQHRLIPAAEREPAPLPLSMGAQPSSLGDARRVPQQKKATVGSAPVSRRSLIVAWLCAYRDACCVRVSC